MPKQPSQLPTTETVTLVPTVSARDATKSPKFKLPPFNSSYLGHFLLGVWALTAGLMTATNLHTVQFLERQAQTALFRARGSVAPPREIVVLGVDDQDPAADAKALAQLTIPIRRAVYAEVIDRLMQAGAKAVAVDFLLDQSSSFGDPDPNALDCIETEQEARISPDDQQLVKVLQKYPRRVVLAADFFLSEGLSDGSGNPARLLGGPQNTLTLPYCPFRKHSMPGFIKFPLEPVSLLPEAVQPNDKKGGRVHRLGSESNRAFKQESIPGTEAAKETLISFAEAALQAAKTPYAMPQGDHIFFYGPARTFENIPFWKVLSPDNFAQLQKGGAFKDKIVLIGITKAGEDVLRTPFGDMPGVEIHANAIGTLLQAKALRVALPDPKLAGIAVFLVVLTAGITQAVARHSAQRLAWSGVAATSWVGLSYLCFTQGLLILPIAIPVGAIGLTGFSYLGVGIVADRRRAKDIRRDLKRQNPENIKGLIRDEKVRHTLLQERELELLNRKLQDRYKIVGTLGSGGFGEAFIAEDTQQPSNPKCVVKQLCPISNNPNRLNLAITLFEREAKILERLGRHDQIPQLLAYFEENDELYLVQEFIAGEPLSAEITLGRHLAEVRVIEILRQLLQILTYVHDQDVVHRDIKPSNVIKRQADNKLVLIDFGAVTELKNRLAEGESLTNQTVGIGTHGYMPPEQSAGTPKVSSDIYALGVLGIQALTGLPPRELKSDPVTNELLWQSKVQVSSGLATVLTKMVRYDHRQRYQSAPEALAALSQLSDCFQSPRPLEAIDFDALDKNHPLTTTKPWPNQFADDSDLPPTDEQKSLEPAADPELPPTDAQKSQKSLESTTDPELPPTAQQKPLNPN
jgi:serine/threonine protein kinase/CHASE2 domain-containing sensor protein